MKQPALPEDELQRLHALRRYGVLDSQIEQVFDEFVVLVAKTFDVPIALISLVDSERQWFKARVGIEGSETPREVSFCGHVVADRDPLIVEDTLEDVRFFDNPLVTGGPKIRFYAGAPLLTPEGYILGTFCVVDQKPRTLRADQLETLQLFARQVMRILELRREAALSAIYRRLFETTKAFVAIVSQQGTILEVNRVWSDRLGLSPEENALRGWFKLAVPEDGSKILQAFEIAKAGGVGEFELRMRAKAGDICWVSWHVTEDTNEGFLYCVGHDVTASIKAAEEAARVARMKSEFVSVVSHELRTPLTAVQVALGLLDGGVVGELSGEPREMVQIALVGAKRLARVIDDILDLRDVESGLLKLDLQDVELSGVARRAIADLHAEDDRARVVLEAPEPLWVRLDPERLYQILTNLLSNAIRFSPSGLPIGVRIEHRGPSARVSVSDCGPGIPEAFQARVFEPFAQADASDVRRKNGAGLGLSIAKALVERLEGKIHFSSTENEGTTFHLEFPCVLAPSEVLQ